MASNVQDLIQTFSVLSSDSEPVEMIGLRAEIKLWFERPFNEYPDRFLDVYDMLLARLCDQLKWYQNYTMNRFSPITAKVFDAPRAWLQLGQADSARMLCMKGPGPMKAVADFAIDFKYHPQGTLHSDSNTPYLRVVTPAEALRLNPAGFLQIIKQICEHLPFLCGHVGYSIETSPYFENLAYRKAYPLAMRHPGVNIAGDQATWALRDEPGVETVNWLTLVGERPLATLGGAKAVRAALAGTPEIDVIDTAHGLIIQAGPEALIGDVNRQDMLPLYRKVYKTLAAVIEPVIRDTRPLLLANELQDEDEMTMAWLRRFGS